MQRVINSISESKVICEKSINNREYHVIFENFHHIDIGEYYTYGIKYGTDSLKVVHDISTCRENVEKMVILFNRCRLSPTHLFEVVEDMVGQL